MEGIDIKKTVPHFSDNDKIYRHLQNAISYHDKKCHYQALWLIYKYWHDVRPLKESQIPLWQANLNFGYYRHSLEQWIMPLANAISTQNPFKWRIYHDLYLRTKEDYNSQENILKRQQQREEDPDSVLNTRIAQKLTGITQHWYSRIRGIDDFHAQLIWERENYGSAIAALGSHYYKPRILERRLFITEPGATIDPDTWNICWYMPYMTVAEILERSEKDEDSIHWKKDNIQKAFGEKFEDREPKHSTDEQTPFSLADKFCGKETAALPVLELWCRNDDNTIDHKIVYKADSAKITLMEEKNSHRRMSDAIFPFVADPGVKLIEDQRSGGHNALNIVPLLNRQLSDIGNLAKFSSLVPIKSNIEYTKRASKIEIPSSGIFDVGNHEFAQLGIDKNLQQLMIAHDRGLAYLSARLYLSGLDGNDKLGNDKEGRGGSMFQLRLLKDNNYHKWRREVLAHQFRPLFQRMLYLALSDVEGADEHTRCLLHDRIEAMPGINKEIFDMGDPDKDFDADENKHISEETGLPCWLSIEPIRNADSSFNAADTIIANNLEQYRKFLPNSLQQTALTRFGMTAHAGTYVAEDILSLDSTSEDADEAIEAENEHIHIFASVDPRLISFRQYRVKSNDNDIVHLAKAHVPELDRIRQELDEQVDFGPQGGGDDTERVLQYAALSFHAKEHTDIMESLGEESPEAGELREKVYAHYNSATSALQRIIADAKGQIARQGQNGQNGEGQELSPEDQAKASIELAKLEVQRDKAIAVRDAERERSKTVRVTKAAELFHDRNEKDKDRKLRREELAIKKQEMESKRNAEAPRQDSNN